MKKTFKFFMMAAIVAAGFTACSDETTPIIGVDDNGNTVIQGEPTYATFNFDGLESKALTEATTESAAVQNLRVLIFSGYNPASTARAEIDTTVFLPAGDARKVTIYLPSGGEKKIYVITNDDVTKNLALKGATMTHGTLTNPIDLGLQVENLAKVKNAAGEFFMTNRADSTNFKLIPNVKEAESQDPTNSNYINLGVRRVVAKNAVTQVQASFNTLDGKGTVTTAQYRLWNINKDVYPFFSGVSPNATGIDWTDTLAVKAFYGYRVGLSTAPGFISVAQAGTRPSNGYYYVPENTRLSNYDFDFRGATYAAIKAIYTPKANHHYAAITSYTGVGKTFGLSTSAADASAGTFWKLINANVPVGYVFNAALPDTAIFTSKLAVQQLVYHFTTGAAETTLQTNATTLNAVATDAEIAKYFVEYTNGEAWYRYDLGSGSLDKSGDDKSVYDNFTIGLVRNTAYWASITGYKGLGEPREEDLNIPGPMVNGPTYLTVEVHVIPWTEAKAEGIL